MNYLSIYQAIVNRRKETPYQGYVEKHHIIPKSVGGTDHQDNIVSLSAREHFICHWLLVKIYGSRKNTRYAMLKAFNMMLSACSQNQKRHRTNSRIFSKYREEFSSMMSELQSGANNSQYGKKWICNIECRVNMKIRRDDLIPDGWAEGRNLWNRKVIEYKDRRKINDVDARSLLDDYESGMQMSEILKKHNRKSEQSVTTFLRKRFPDRKKFKPGKRASRL